jgi:biopolymer transport protein TolR
MLKPRDKPSRLICGIDRTPFVNVAVVLAAVFLIIEISIPPPHHGTSIDLPSVSSPTSMPHADREDALMVAVMRDGKIFFGSGPVWSWDLRDKIQERVSRGAERKVYIKADARVQYGSVKAVIDAIHAAGIEQIGILVEQRKQSATVTQ